MHAHPAIVRYYKSPPAAQDVWKFCKRDGFAFERSLLPVQPVEPVSREARAEAEQLWFSAPESGVNTDVVLGLPLSQRSMAMTQGGSSIATSQSQQSRGTVATFTPPDSLDSSMSLFDGAFNVSASPPRPPAVARSAPKSVLPPPAVPRSTPPTATPAVAPPVMRAVPRAVPAVVPPRPAPVTMPAPAPLSNTTPPTAKKTAIDWFSVDLDMAAAGPPPPAARPVAAPAPPAARPVAAPAPAPTSTQPVAPSAAALSNTLDWLSLFGSAQSNPGSVASTPSSSVSSRSRTATSTPKSPPRSNVILAPSSGTHKRKATHVDTAAAAATAIASWQTDMVPGLQCIDSNDACLAFQDWMIAQQQVAAATLYREDSAKLRWNTMTIFGCCISNGEQHWYIPLSEQPETAADLTGWQLLSDLLCLQSVQKVIWQAKSVLGPMIDLLPSHGSQWCELCDPQVAAWLLDTDAEEKALKLRSVCQAYNVMISDDFPDQFGACGSAHSTVVIAWLGKMLALHATLLDRLRTESLTSVYFGLEMRLVPVLAHMEHRGIRVQPEFLDSMIGDLEVAVAESEADAHRMAGRPFLLSSPQEVSKVLFEELGLPVPPIAHKSATGHVTTNEAVLQQLAEHHALPAIILHFRRSFKILNTYARPLPECAVLHGDNTSNIHSTLHQLRVGTGRLSSSDPNLQNIPSSAEFGIREAFVAKEGCVLMSFDYCQIEVRVLAHMCQDQSLLRLFRCTDDTKGDFYKQMAAQVFRIPVEAVKDSERSIVKTVCLGFIYGMGPAEAARKLDISELDARKWKDMFSTQYPGLRTFGNAVIDRYARKHGHVVTLLGRKRLLPDITSTDGVKRAYAERQAVNSVIQGSAADIIKLTMIDLHERSRDSPLGWNLVLQIHDELLVECPADPAVYTQVAAIVRDAMEKQVCAQLTAYAAQHMQLRDFQLAVPLAVKVCVGRSWGSMLPLEEGGAPTADADMAMGSDSVPS